MKPSQVEAPGARVSARWLVLGGALACVALVLLVMSLRGGVGVRRGPANLAARSDSEAVRIQAEPLPERSIVELSPLPEWSLTVEVRSDGIPVPGAEVYAHVPRAGDGTPDVSPAAAMPAAPEHTRILAQGAADGSGRVVMSLSPPWTRRPIDVVAREAGFAPGGVRGVVVEDLSQRILTVDLRRGHALSGVAVDGGGAPAAGIQVFATTHRQIRPMLVRNNQLVRETVDCRPPLGSSFVARAATTDHAGRFRIEGLPRGEYVLNVLADGLVMEPHPTVPAGASDLRLVVTRAVDVRLVVLDASSRAPVESFSAVVSLGAEDSAFPVMASGQDGSLDLSIQQPDGFTAGGEGRYIVKAATFETAQGTLSWGSAGGGASGEVLLRAVRMVPVAIEAVDRSGNPVFAIRGRAESLDGAAAVRLTMQRSETRLQTSIPPGAWDVLVWHEDAFPLAEPWRDTVTIDDAGLLGSPSLRVQLDLRNRVELDVIGDRPGRGPIESIRFESAAGSVQMSGPFEALPIQWFGLPMGEWHIYVRLADGRIWDGAFFHDGQRTSLRVSF